MGTHPIFESDFDCLTECRKKNSTKDAEMAEEEYEVEKILASRVLLDGKKYLVKWKGWPDDQNSWEPADNVEADEEIKHYEEIRRSWRSKMPKNSKFLFQKE